MLFEQQWDLRILQRRKDELKFRFVTPFPNRRYRLLIRFLLRRNERQMAVATLREARTEFGFAQRAEHGA